MSTAAEPATAGELALRAAEEEQLGRWELAARLYSQSFRAALDGGDVENAADALRGQARVLIREDRLEEANELAELSLEIAERAGLLQSTARAINVLDIIRHVQRDWTGARDLFSRATELALDVGDDELAGLARQNAGVVAYGQGDLREARSLYLESVGSFVRSGNSENAVHAYNNLGVASSELHEWLEADIYFARGIEIAERISHSPLLATLYGNRAEPLINVGELEQARESLDRGERAANAVGDRVALAVIERSRAAICRLQNRFAEADEHLERARSFAPDPSLQLAEIYRELGELRVAQGRREGAREAYQRGREVSVELAAWGHVRAMDKRIADLG